MNTPKLYPELSDLFTWFEKKNLLIQIANNDESMDYDFLVGKLVESCHRLYDASINDVTINERYKLHRHLEKALYDDNLVILGEDWWFMYTYGNEPDIGAEDPFYDVVEPLINLDELGL